jgi:hypothetical protein
VLPAAQAVAVISTFSVPHTLPPPVMLGDAGTDILVIFIALEATLTPHEVEHVAVIAWVVDTWILKPVAPVDHVIVPPTQPVAVMVATWPSQHSVLSAFNSGAAVNGNLPIVIVDAGDVPHASEQVAVYVPGPTSFGDPVPKLFDHVIIPPSQPLAVIVVLSEIQISFAPVNTGAVGAGLVPIVTSLDNTEMPQVVAPLFVHVAVYLPGPTNLLVPVPKLPDHVIVPPKQPSAVISVVLLTQTSLAAFNTGAAGAGLAPTVIGVEFKLLPQMFSQYALYVPAPTLIV